MISQGVQNMIPAIQNYFSCQPVQRAYLFGSCSRGEETPASDVDILINFTDNTLSLMSISRMMVQLSKLLNRKVDIVEEDGLLESARNNVNNDKLLIYERTDS